MSFFNGLKRVEKILTNVAEAITPEDVSSGTACFTRTSSSGRSDGIHIREGVFRDRDPSSPYSIGQEGEMNRNRNINVTSTSLRGDWGDFLGMSTESEFLQYFSDMLHMLQDEIFTTIIPAIPDQNRQDLIISLRQEMNAQVLLRDAHGVLEQCQKKQQQEQKNGNGRSNANANSEDATNEAKANLEQFQVISTQTKDDLLNTGANILSFVQEQWKCDENWEWEMKVLQATILSNATPQRLASYAYASSSSQSSKNEDINTTQPYHHIHNMLHDAPLMKEILAADGPSGQNYANFLRIYHQICSTSLHTKRRCTCTGTTDATSARTCNSNSVEFNIFDRLALAVALEHANPIKIFDTQIIIDPVARYAHYEGAYLRGELDPAFSTLSTWELRMVVNNDASDDEIQWCRDMLRNYRPDHIMDRNDAWRYCMVVRTDVDYKRPVWKDGCPRTYKQMISGGGMCGPRAWFGRYACKSFGIPTWGIRQPGHAAMSHWTQSGEWVINLGGSNWKKSWWGVRNGVDFHVETRARIWGNENNGKEYEKILWLQCFANIRGEVQVGSQNAKFHERNVEQRLWSELASIQKEIFAFNTSACSVNEATEEVRRQRRTKSDGNQSNVLTLIESLRYDSISSNEESISHDLNGCIRVPAAICTITGSNGKVIIMKCFHGGRQIHARDGATFEYQVQVPQTHRYLLHMNIVTVHSRCETEPLRLTMIDGVGRLEEKCHDIEIPYSEGEWAKTKPAELEFREGVINKLVFKCPPALRISIKDFTLTPSS